jgi:hypothetical protein
MAVQRLRVLDGELQLILRLGRDVQALCQPGYRDGIAGHLETMGAYLAAIPRLQGEAAE